MIQTYTKSVSYIGFGGKPWDHRMSVLDGRSEPEIDSGKLPIPIGGTFRKLNLYTEAIFDTNEGPPFTAGPVTVTLEVNGVLTSLSATIATGDIQTWNDVNEVTVAPGDIIAYRIVSPTRRNPAIQLAMAIEFEGAQQVFGVAAQGGFATINAGWIGGAFGNGLFQVTNTAALAILTDSNTYSITAIDGSVTTLAMHTFAGAPGAGVWTGYLRKNGVAQDGSGGTVDTRAVLTGAATSVIVNFDLPVTPPDHVDVVVLRSGTNTGFVLENVGVGVAFRPTTDGQYMYCGGVNIQTPATPITWRWNNSQDVSKVGAPPDAETLHTTPAGRTGLELIAMYVERNAPPGVGNSMTHTALRNGTPTTVVVSLTNLQTTGQISGLMEPYAVADLLTIQLGNSGATPTNAYFHWGIGVEAVTPIPPPPPECPGLIEHPRVDGLPYEPPVADECAGTGERGAPRTGA